MSTLTYIIIFSLVGGLVSLLGGALLLLRKKSAAALVRYATPFAAGALIATVFIDLLPEGIAETDHEQLFIWTLIGIVVFYIAERFLRWFHHHHSDDETEAEAAQHHSSRSLIIVGDLIHNALDGTVIAAAFLVSIPTGIVTTLVVAAHEIPQEIGDFGLLLSRGMSRSRVLIINALSALATVVAAVITYWLGSADALPLAVLIGISAGFLLYIALSDIIPELHRHSDNHNKLFSLQPILLIAGVLVVSFAVMTAHNIAPHDHDEGSDTHEQITNSKHDHS